MGRAERGAVLDVVRVGLGKGRGAAGGRVQGVAPATDGDDDGEHAETSCGWDGGKGRARGGRGEGTRGSTGHGRGRRRGACHVRCLE